MAQLTFKTPRLCADWPLVHPELRGLVDTFVRHSAALGLPDPLVTDAVRDRRDQVRIYVAHYRRLQAALLPGPHQGHIDPEDDGVWRPLTQAEVQEALAIQALDAAALDARAAARFTWHWARCAADLRTRHYSGPQLAAVARWFKARCARPDWEWVIHDVTAPHLHVARRDEAWRARYAPRPEAVS